MIEFYSLLYLNRFVQYSIGFFVIERCCVILSLQHLIISNIKLSNWTTIHVTCISIFHGFNSKFGNNGKGK